MVQVSQAELIEGAIANQVVSFPTDTVPALAVKPEVANKIFQLKQRPKHKPLILMGASLAELLTYTSYTANELAAWQELIDEYLPGALTLVLPASAKVDAALNPTNFNTIGIRIPDHPIANEILRQTGVLATSSANISGQQTLQDLDEINQLFPDVLVLAKSDFLVKEKNSSGQPSTVVCWQDQTWQVLRQGRIKIKLKK